MEPENLTVRLLQEIRDDARTSARETRLQFEKMDQRFEVIETSLRDLAQQLVLLTHGIKSALEPLEKSH